MSRAAQGTAVFAPVGPPLENGYDAGGARIYPMSTGLAIMPPAYYSDYLGPATGLPTSPPVGSMTDTVGSNGTSDSAILEAVANPFGRTSPLPWVIGGIFVAVGALYAVHYHERRE